MGECPAGSHKPGEPGATPGPATFTAGYANWKSGEIEGLVTLWVRLPPRLLRVRSFDPVVQRQRRLVDIQETDGSTPSGIIRGKWLVASDQWLERRRVVAELVRVRRDAHIDRIATELSRLQLRVDVFVPTRHWPLVTSHKLNGLLVQRDDSWLATRQSGFDSPAVH